MNIEFQSEALQHFPLAVTELSPGWQCVVLADIAATVSPGFASGKHNSDGSGIPHLRPMNVDRDGNIDLNVIKSVASTEGRELAEGDVLVNNTNSAELIGKTALISMREKGYAYSNHMTRIRPEAGIASRYVALQLHFFWMVGYAKHRCTNHVNQASISSQTLAKTIPFLLPPAAEQTRIVEKLEELLSDLDVGVAELKAAQKKLGQYRQSLLKAAVEGALTAEWRAAQHAGRKGKAAPVESGAALLARILAERRSRWETRQLAKFQDQDKTPPKDWKTKYSEPVAPDTSGLPDLPVGWAWASLDSLIDDGPQNGLYLPATRYGHGCPILRIDDFQIGWARSRDDLNLVDADLETVATYALQAGDVVINRVNSMTHLGKSLVISKSLDGVLFESNMMRSRLSPSIDAEYVGLYLGSELGRKRLTRDAKWAVNQASINQQDVKRTPIPISSFAEQQKVSGVVMCLLEAADTQAKAISKSLQQSAAQRKNILQAAFSGQLVPQDPADEPASALLTRIQSERATRKTGAGRTRGKKGVAT